MANSSCQEYKSCRIGRQSFKSPLLSKNCANCNIWQFKDGMIPLQATTLQVKELKIPYELGKVHINFPKNGIAGVVNNYFTTTAMPQMGIFKCTLTDEWGIFPILK